MKTQKFMLGDIPAILRLYFGARIQIESMSMSTAR